MIKVTIDTSAMVETVLVVSQEALLMENHVFATAKIEVMVV